MKRWMILALSLVFFFASVATASAELVQVQPKSFAQIKVISPGGGDWKRGSVMPITFSISSDKLKLVNISVKKGVNVYYSFPHIAVRDPAHTTFNWNIPQDAIVGDNYTVEIFSEESPAIRGVSASFSIVSSGPSVSTAKTTEKIAQKTDAKFLGNKHINITSPSVGDRWTLPNDGTVTVLWDHPANQKVATVDILLLKSDGSVLKPLASGISFAAGKYIWNLSGSNVDPGEYQIKVKDTATGDIGGTSDSFVLEPPAISFESPLANDYLLEGTTRVFSWNFTGSNKQKIKITDGNDVIADNVSINAGNKGPGKGAVELRVPELRLNIGEYEKSKEFTIRTTGSPSASATVKVNVATPFPLITSPVGDQTVMGGGDLYVTWTYNGNPSDQIEVAVVIIHPQSNGRILTPVGTTTAGAGSFMIYKSVLLDFIYKNGYPSAINFTIRLTRYGQDGALSQNAISESGLLTFKFK